MKVEGYKCDIDGCPSFSKDRANWIPIPRFDEHGEIGEYMAEVCSPACAVKFWQQTVRAEKLMAEQEQEPPEPESLEHQAKLAVIARRNGQRDQREVWCGEPECGAGPFKGEQGLAMHRTRVHEGKYWNNHGTERPSEGVRGKAST